jgi:hypothetical protein
VPVIIRDPDAPLGTFLYTATEPREDGSAMRWVVVNLENGPAIPPERRKGNKKAAHQDSERTLHVSASVRQAAASALDRVDIPQDVFDRISGLLSPGASLIISDLPLSHETGKYTDFIILTR